MTTREEAMRALTAKIDAAFDDRIGILPTPSILVRRQRWELAEIAASAITDAALATSEADNWRPISEWKWADGAHVIGWTPKWGVTEFMRHDDGWTVATFNGSLRRGDPFLWQPMLTWPLKAIHRIVSTAPTIAPSARTNETEE